MSNWMVDAVKPKDKINKCLNYKFIMSMRYLNQYREEYQEKLKELMNIKNKINQFNL